MMAKLLQNTNNVVNSHQFLELLTFLQCSADGDAGIIFNVVATNAVAKNKMESRKQMTKGTSNPKARGHVTL